MIGATFGLGLRLESTNGKVWTFDQLQGILYVIVPVRMTVIKLDKSEGGGLFVYAPVAPTGECMAMMRKLEAEHGPVRHIVLGTLGLEHKVFAGPFAQRFSEASVWFTPGQYRCVFCRLVFFLGFSGVSTHFRMQQRQQQQHNIKLSEHLKCRVSKRLSLVPPKAGTPTSQNSVSSLKRRTRLLSSVEVDDVCLWCVKNRGVMLRQTGRQAGNQAIRRASVSHLMRCAPHPLSAPSSHLGPCARLTRFESTTVHSPFLSFPFFSFPFFSFPQFSDRPPAIVAGFWGPTDERNSRLV